MGGVGEVVWVGSEPPQPVRLRARPVALTSASAVRRAKRICLYVLIKWGMTNAATPTMAGAAAGSG